MILFALTIAGVVYGCTVTLPGERSRISRAHAVQSAHRQAMGV